MLDVCCVFAEVECEFRDSATYQGLQAAKDHLVTHRWSEDDQFCRYIQMPQIFHSVRFVGSWEQMVFSAFRVANLDKPVNALSTSLA